MTFVTACSAWLSNGGGCGGGDAILRKGLRSIRASVSDKDLQGYTEWNNTFGTQQYQEQDEDDELDDEG